MDIRVNDEYVKVTNKDGSLALAKYFGIARIETGGTIERGRLSDITIQGLPEIPAKGEMIEKDNLYNLSGKTVVCLKTVIVSDNTKDDPEIIKKDEKVIDDIITEPKSK